MYERAGFAFLQQNCDYRQLAIIVRVYKVYGHIEAFPIDLLFAGPVKVELLERVFLVADRNKASRAVVHHDGMGVIDDVERRGLIFEPDLWQGSFLRVADVDGGLAMPGLTRCKLRFQVTPMTRPQ